MRINASIASFMFAVALVSCGQQTVARPAPLPPIATVASAYTSTPAATPTATASPTPSELDPLVAAAQQEGELNVIALPPDWMNYGGVITTFAQRYNIIVNQLDPGGSSAGELNAIKATKTKDRKSAPDVIDVGLPFAVRAKEAGLLQPYKVSTWATIPESAKDAEAAWYGDYYGIIVFEVNSQAVTEIPQDWPDLLKPGYKIAKPVAPSAGYKGMITVYSASLANGGSMEDTLPGLRFFQQLNRNGGLLEISPTGDTVASGETPIVLNWDYLALADQEAHPDGSIKVVVPKSGNIAGLYAQGISAYAPHPNAAKLWMEFLYSDEGQLLYLQGLGHPVRFAALAGRGVIPAELLGKLLPPEPYVNALFPTAVQISAADESILGSWSSYVP
jgi:putative spermidine/putrescine transport system substrate-binding protein